MNEQRWRISVDCTDCFMILQISGWRSFGKSSQLGKYELEIINKLWYFFSIFRLNWKEWDVLWRYSRYRELYKNVIHWILLLLFLTLNHLLVVNLLFCNTHKDKRTRKRLNNKRFPNDKSFFVFSCLLLSFYVLNWIIKKNNKCLTQKTLEKQVNSLA